jgi:hypothetical protein
VTRNYEPEHPVTLYQARCTNCGYIEDDYGEFSAMGAGQAIEAVTDYMDWFARWVVDSREAGTVKSHMEELLCPKCQRCEVCNAEKAYPIDGDHLVCEDHEDYDFPDQ